MKFLEDIEFMEFIETNSMNATNSMNSNSLLRSLIVIGGTKFNKTATVIQPRYSFEIRA